MMPKHRFRAFRVKQSPQRHQHLQLNFEALFKNGCMDAGRTHSAFMPARSPLTLLKLAPLPGARCSRFHASPARKPIKASRRHQPPSTPDRVRNF